MAPIRGTTNGACRKSTRIASRGGTSLPNNLQARVLLNRLDSDALATATHSTRNEDEAQNILEPEAPPEPEVRPPARRGPGRPRRSLPAPARAVSPARAASPEPEPIPTSPEPMVVDHIETTEAVVADPAPVTPEQRNEVAIVDLVTPGPANLPPPRALGRPVEVDLTCDLDDEVFVLLEDIVNPSRRANTGNPFPVVLGASPPRVRTLPLPSRSFRRHYARPLMPNEEEGPPMLTDLRGDPLAVVDLSQGSQSSTRNPTEPSSKEPPAAVGIQCPICLDTLEQIKAANKKVTSTTCGHIFCGPCIKQAVVESKQCPSCRKSLDMRKIHPIFI